MAPKKRTAVKPKSAVSGTLPMPFKKAPEVLQPFLDSLSEKHVYIAHVDFKPWEFKRKIFAVPVALNLSIALLFAWRVWYIGPYYLDLFLSFLGYANETTVIAAETPWKELTFTVLRRAFSFMLDFVLAIFVWPWPLEFVFSQTHGSPVRWRWNVGFRDREIYVRRSRSWDRNIGDVLENSDGRSVLLSYVGVATSPMLLNEKTGYLTINGEWDLDWAAMVHATTLVDKNVLALDAFKTLVLIHNKESGWLCIDLKMSENAQDDERRRHVFAFRDALAAVGKEDLFFRWIEIVQFESSQPGGFGAEKQIEVAQKIRDLFQSNDIDFDEFWKESVGTDGIYGM